MKLINKLSLRELNIYFNDGLNYNSYFKELFYEKEAGLLGNECRFLVKLINSFQTEVSIF
jgi:hypothetical protein